MVLYAWFSKKDKVGIKLVIFDVDGTVYNQKQLRSHMLVELLKFIFRSPLSFYKIRLLSEFRKMVERSRKPDSSDYYARIIKALSEKYRIKESDVTSIIHEWMFQRPLKYLKNKCNSEITDVINFLEQEKIEWTFYSDYFPDDKLDMLGIKYGATYYSSMDKINCLKPDQRSVITILSDYRVQPQETLVIGDRVEIDGQLAINSNTHFILFKASRSEGKLMSSVRLVQQTEAPGLKKLHFIN